MTGPRVTAVVVVHGSPTTTVSACIESLLASQDVDLRVVLVDNASPDGGAACRPWQGHADVIVTRAAQNAGFASGVNHGLRRRRPGDLVWLLNDDATVAPDAIRRCVDALGAGPRIVAVAPRVMLAAEPDRVDSIGVVLRPNGEAFNAYIGHEWAGQVTSGQRLFGPCFAAVLFRADAFDVDVVGILDERYHLYYEDIDWALRAQRSGWQTVAEVDAVVHHQHAASARQLGEPARYELVQRNLLICVTKNFTGRSAARAWLNRLVVHAKGVVTGPYRVQRLRALGSAVAQAPSAIAARRGLPRHRAVAEDVLFAYSTGLAPAFDPATMRSIRP